MRACSILCNIYIGNIILSFSTLLYITLLLFDVELLDSNSYIITHTRVRLRMRRVCLINLPVY